MSFRKFFGKKVDRSADHLKARPIESFEEPSDSSNPGNNPVTDSTNLLANESPSIVSMSLRGK